MANPAVTYTFSNSTTADASQVNQNFTDIINGLTDGTKDLSISALTCAGTATFNGNVALGNATGDDITVTGSLASTIPIKTTYSYDIGAATIGLRSVYLGSSDSAARSTRLIGATVASSWTMTLPTGVPAAARYRLESDASGVTSWQPVYRSPGDLHNLGLACSISSNQLVIAVKGADGNDPSSSNPVDIVFRNATAATGTPVTRTLTSALSVTLGTTTSLGIPTATAGIVVIYLFDNAGAYTIGASLMAADEGTLQSSSTTATSNAVIYQASALSSKPVRILGQVRATWTSGTGWSSITQVSLAPFAFGPRSEVYVDTPNGHGSSSTKVRKYSGTPTVTGSAMSYTSDSIDGFRITINEPGLYVAEMQDGAGAVAAAFGVAKNLSAGTTGISAQSTSVRVALTNNVSGQFGLCTTAPMILKVGDTVWPMSDGSVNDTSTTAHFRIVKVSD